MRRAWIVLATVVTTVGFVGVGAAGATSSRPSSKPSSKSSSKPVNVDGKVNVKGTKDISAKKAATLDLEADDFYFEPTFVKVKPGEKVTIELENEGDATHTFTSDSLDVDQQVAAGKSKKLTFTVPSGGTAFEFHCSFHQGMGMRGAFYTKVGATAR